MEAIVLICCMLVVLAIGYAVGHQVGFARGQAAAKKDVLSFQRRNG